MKALFILVISFCVIGLKAQNKKSSGSKIDTATIIDPNFVETNPKFPGGEQSFRQFLKKNLKWPKTNIDSQGKIWIIFTIQKDGSVTNAKIIRGIGSPFDEEALRVIKKSPKWIPATQNGKRVKVQYTISIPFYLRR